VKSHGEVFSR